jgi:hypothetical protein
VSLPRRLAACVALLGACPSAPPADPLDPDEVDEVAKSGGDAEGDARSGSYRLQAGSVAACDCPEVQGVDLCAASLTGLGDDSVVLVTQSDGYLLLAPEVAPGSLALGGSIDADGGFDLAGVYDLASVFGEGSLTTRMTGAFENTDRFAAVLHTRVDGTVLGDAIDCRTELDLTGERIDPAP